MQTDHAAVAVSVKCVIRGSADMVMCHPAAAAQAQAAAQGSEGSELRMSQFAIL
jgi:hypothetical protein